MDRRDYDYDEDVFSLDDDLARERRKQWIQYLVVAICAAAVVALALYGAITLTLNRLAAEANERPTNVIAQPDDTGEPVALATPESTDFWPSTLFPGIPVLESVAYDTRTASGFAEIKVPAATARNFDAYIAELTELGATVYVRTPRLNVILLEGVEIHMISSNQGNRVVLCKEPTYAWSDPTYNAFPLPEYGRLVSVRESGLTRELTYRNATPLDALEYVNSLTQDGWTLSGSLEPTNNIFACELKKNNLRISVDYFSADDNHSVKLDFQN